MVKPSAPWSISTAGPRSLEAAGSASNHSTLIGIPLLVNVSTCVVSAATSRTVDIGKRKSGGRGYEPVLVYSAQKRWGGNKNRRQPDHEVPYGTSGLKRHRDPQLFAPRSVEPSRR